MQILEMQNDSPSQPEEQKCEESESIEEEDLHPVEKKVRALVSTKELAGSQNS